MKILILGGTAFLGRHLVEAAQARGDEVSLFNRGQSNPQLFPEVEQLRGDRTKDLSALAGRRWDVVIDTCGYVPSVVRASAQLLAGAAEHYTFVSSLSVYADFERHGMDESARTQTLTDEQVSWAEAIKPTEAVIAANYAEMYGGLKALCERAASEAMEGRAFNVRAGLIVGPYDKTDRFTYWVRRVALGGEVLAPGAPARPVQFVDARDLALWILRMAEERRAGTYNACGPKSLMTMERLLEEFRSASGSDARFTWVSDRFLSGKVAGWTEVPMWLPEFENGEASNIRNFFSVDCSKAFETGLEFRPVAETARDTLAWDRTRDDSQLKAGLQTERERELLAQWHSEQSTDTTLL